MSILALNISCLSSVVDLCIAQCLPQQVCQVCSSYTLSQVGNQGSFHRCPPVFLIVTCQCHVATSVDNFRVSVFALCIDQVLPQPVCQACKQPCNTISWMSSVSIFAMCIYRVLSQPVCRACKQGRLHTFMDVHPCFPQLHVSIIQQHAMTTSVIIVSMSFFILPSYKSQS